MESTLKQDKFKPPYISVTKMQDLLNLLSNRSFSTLTIEDLIDRGFSKSDANQGILGLKFLCLVDPAGKTSEDVRLLSMKGDTKEQKLQEIIKRAYQKIFDTIQNLESVTRDELYNEFVAVYKLSPRLANTAVPVFIWLCNEAGIKISDQISLKTGGKKSRDREKKTVQRKEEVKKGYNNQKIQDSSLEDFHSYNLFGIILKIPKKPEIDDAITAGKLSKIRDEIIVFAEEVGLKKN